MAIVLLAAVLVFLMFGKNIVIGYNAFMSDAEKTKTVGYFSAFILLVSVLWLMLKYLYKPLAALTFMIVGFVIVKKVRNGIDKLSKEEP